MIENYRSFTVDDLFGRTWRIEFAWQQTAISIRHADAVDVKWRLSTQDESTEKVLALPHPLLQAASEEFHHPLTDPWCMKLAASHLKQMIETWQDMDKTLVTLSREELQLAAEEVSGWEAARREAAFESQ